MDFAVKSNELWRLRIFQNSADEVLWSNKWRDKSTSEADQISSGVSAPVALSSDSLECHKNQFAC